MAGGIVNKKHRVLFLADHRLNRSPGQRFRFEQYLGDLRQGGFDCDISYLLDEKQDRIFYRPGHFIRKAFILLSHYIRRWRDLQRAEQYDMVFIFRQALLTRSIFFEKAWKRKGVRIIFDFDDSIWLPNVSPHNRAFGLMKNPSKTQKIIGLADCVFAGNDYLKRFALQFNRRVEVVPTTIDLRQYCKLKTTHTTHPICIGWSGSLTTIAHFKTIEPVLATLKSEFGESICFKVIGDTSYVNARLGIQGEAWNAHTEVDDLLRIDIGLMPLPDDPWTSGKCGLKGLQYMALGIPTVMSAVGVNTQIIRDGENGFLAKDSEAMLSAIRILILDADLRERIGREGRRTVEKDYSHEAWKDRYIELFNRVIEKE